MYWLVRSLWIRNNDRLSNGLENKRAYRTAAWRGVRLLASRVFTSTPPSSKAFIVSTLFVLAAMCKRESSSLFLSCKLSPSTEYSITNVDFLSLFSIRSQGLPSQMFSPFLVGVELSITSPRSPCFRNSKVGLCGLQFFLCLYSSKRISSWWTSFGPGDWDIFCSGQESQKVHITTKRQFDDAEFPYANLHTKNMQVSLINQQRPRQELLN